MSGFWKCVAYLAATGLANFLIGRALPKRWFDGNAFPYRSLPFEKQGNLYRRLYIHKWQSHVPDMSRIFGRWMPPKRLNAGVTPAQVEVMVQETCIAEISHVALCVTGIGLLWVWPGTGGRVFYLVGSLLGNLPFILIQRFNRPKLMALQARLNRRANAAAQAN